MSASVLQAALLVVLAAGAAAITHAVHPRAPALYLSEAPLREDEVSLKQIQERWQGDVIWLDARPQEVFEKGHIPEARMLNEQGFQEQLLELLDVLQTTDKPVIIYCGGEKCEASRTIREKLLPLVPLEHCYILKGGWPAWQAAQK
ncbi:rhodanese-like domain-containing protein [Prosthecobacter fusiformis]|uniref:Rhodanese-like domain-containing protein n=1 Tax=Prosthecobacter fusiformis TaxID=48464 RepID=A0A4R7S5L2_9BACT|nr:rhodanese-like domain-containing protein [Prosthecobacter fusiformis]TDU72828.1 rhodanese-like domain-containing protein [Prosthecobacter fusiformis]